MSSSGIAHIPSFQIDHPGAADSATLNNAKTNTTIMMDLMLDGTVCGTTSCCSSQHIGLPGKTNPSATAADLEEKTDEESEMEKWICKEVLGENLSPLNMLDRCLITFSHYQSLTSKSMTISTSSPSVNYIAVSFSIAPESRSPSLLPPLDSPPLILLPSSRSLFRPFCPGGPTQKSAANTNSTRLGTSRMGMRRNWGATYRARG